MNDKKLNERSSASSADAVKQVMEMVSSAQPID
jgi:hypothetical protein